jgi:MarR family transcriptional regulator for hemolysin
MYSVMEPCPERDVRAGVAQALLLTGRRWRTRLNERLKPIGQTDARCAALVEIAGSAGGVVQRQLSLRLGVEEPTVVRLVDALEAQNWVERRTHSADRRAKVVQIMPSATNVLNQAQEIVTGLQDEMFADINRDDLDVCLRVLDQLLTRLGQD